MSKITIFALAALLLFSTIVAAQETTLRDELSGTNCPAVCFLDIVPGVTSQTELEQILNDLNIDFDSAPSETSDEITSYLFNPESLSPYIVNETESVSVKVGMDTVDEISIELTGVTVDDILDWYGAPSVLGGSDSNIMVYSNEGLIFSLDDENTIRLVTILRIGSDGGIAAFLDLEPCVGSATLCSIPTATPGPTPTPTINCPCTIFGDSVPTSPNWSDGKAVELGMRFRASVDGQVTGVRFYKGASNTGTHTGRLWTNDGTLLGMVIFSDETATGWQEASFDTPIDISANTTYVVSYHAPTGYYAVDRTYFSNPIDNPPLRGLDNNEDGLNGVYIYTTGGTFPIYMFNTSNYWVDVIFITSE